MYDKSGHTDPMNNIIWDIPNTFTRYCRVSYNSPYKANN